MPKIVHAEAAPAEEVHYSLGQVEFDLKGSDSYETNDRSILASAEAHPWLEVEYETADTVQYTTEDRQVKPEDDALSSFNSVAFDPEEIREVEEAKGSVYEVTAIDAGKDQDEVVTTGPVAETIAADDEQTDEEEDFS